MIRTALVLFLAVVIAVFIAALLGDPGQVTIVWRPWRIELTAAAGAILLTGFTLLAALLWRLVFWLIATPGRMGDNRADRRHLQALEALARGLAALGRGDRPAALKEASAARDLSPDAAELAAALQSLAGGSPAAGTGSSGTPGSPDAATTPVPANPPSSGLASPPSPAK